MYSWLVEKSFFSNDNSAFFLLTVAIFVIRLVAPLAYFYVTCLFLSSDLQSRVARSPLLVLWTLWMGAEVLYFPYYWVTLRRLGRIKKKEHACETQAERLRLLQQCFDCITMVASDQSQRTEVCREMLSGWFHRSDFEKIRKENVKEWLAWAFFEHSPKSLDTEERRNCQDLMDELERLMEHKFHAGYDPQVKSIRLTMDPLVTMQRPLVFYFVIFFAHLAGWMALYSLGFRYRFVDGHKVHYRLPSQNKERKGEEGGGKEGVRKRPLVFVHGLGIGYLHYARLFWELCRTDEKGNETPMFCLENPNTIMSLGAETGASYKATLKLFSDLLKEEGYKDACFVGHSFGTITVSWLLRHGGEEGRRLVASTVLIDPITFLLCEPSVAYNFIHKEPETAVELMMNFFVSSELYTANTLGRNFSWSHAVVFFEDLPKGPEARNAVVLSSEDSIVPAHKVRAYLDESNRRYKLERRASGQLSPPLAPAPAVSVESGGAGGGLRQRHKPELEREGGGQGEGLEEQPQHAVNIVWFQGAHHGQILMRDSDVELIAKEIRRALRVRTGGWG
uniref:AB hydrolase-1 domain-containing protein n=1 Tax=Chromera velia CCMP2878 TaxID=1169474 RepID=A0A0G4GTA8_9ALVE|eukprot:Cvel_5156.t1-p1 / transcript=Cvel_5156.t1 / gene=Cvel_5156 / organism=Chromera_velia_CCMP2878 / gene_product=hypothetical protein / transcript_product=hypothetical protein / location=Cvel_scaffold236:72270-80730(+) / protein_length=562 / sequence_SO=supercontig / SO=protein_coding / is_pseudo=false